MKLVLASMALASLLPLSASADLHSETKEPPTRQVIGGDLVYRASAIAPTEPRAVFFAEARAARMLSIECGAPPSETKIYQQQTERLSDGSFRTVVEEGAAFADCEAVRQRQMHGHPRLLETISSYEKLERGPAATAVALVAAIVPAATVYPKFLWTDEQEIAHIRAIDAKADERLKERARIASARR